MTLDKKTKNISKNFKKGIDISKFLSIILYVAASAVAYMREWRNWQTRTFEGRVVYTVRVQVPFLAPSKKGHQTVSFFTWWKRAQNPSTATRGFGNLEQACGGAMFFVLRSKCRSATDKKNLPRMRSIRVQMSRFSHQAKKDTKRCPFCVGGNGHRTRPPRRKLLSIFGASAVWEISDINWIITITHTTRNSF